MLGLCPPEPELSQTHRVQKKTRLAGTVDNLPSFNTYKCDRSHIHSVAIGSCVVNGVRCDVAFDLPHLFKADIDAAYRRIPPGDFDDMRSVDYRDLARVFPPSPSAVYRLID